MVALNRDFGYHDYACFPYVLPQRIYPVMGIAFRVSHQKIILVIFDLHKLTSQIKAW